MEGGWNHRVMRRVYPKSVDPKQPYYGIYEVYYDAEGRPDGWTSEPVDVVGDTVEEVAETLRLMLKAVEQPVLDYDAPNPMLAEED